MEDKCVQQLNVLCEAPESHIDKSIKLRLENMRERPNDNVLNNINDILDDCARYSLASDFAMAALMNFKTSILNDIEQY